MSVEQTLLAGRIMFEFADGRLLRYGTIVEAYSERSMYYIRWDSPEPCITYLIYRSWKCDRGERGEIVFSRIVHEERCASNLPPAEATRYTIYPVESLSRTARRLF